MIHLPSFCQLNFYNILIYMCLVYFEVYVNDCEKIVIPI